MVRLISFEQAKELRENGFDEPCRFYYEENGKMNEVNPWGWQLNNSELNPMNRECEKYACPSYDDVCEWLRKRKNLYIVITPYSEWKNEGPIWKTIDYKLEIKHIFETECRVFRIMEKDSCFDYDEAKEFGVDYCIDYLEKQNINN